jgi:hypothetical protein
LSTRPEASTDATRRAREENGAAPWAARARSALAIGSLAAVAALTYVRLYYGIDLTDESFYTAVPYRFVLGARPLIDETNIVQQTPGLLLYPFLKVWDSLLGLDGIILYARHLHFLFSAAVALALLVSLRRILGDRPLSAVLAAEAIALVPFGIHGLSYNTFSTGFFTAGCFLGAAWLWGGGRRTLVAAGAAHGLAVFTYPTFALPVACFFAALYLTSRPRSLRNLAPALLPAAAGALATAVFFVHAGLGTIHELVQRTSDVGGQGGGLGEIGEVLSFVLTNFTHRYLAAALLVAAAALRAWRPAAAVLPLLLLPLAALPADLRTSASANELVTNGALLAPFVFLLIRDSVVGQRLLAVVWLPAAIAGLTTALSSANGGINVAIGFFPALIVTGALIGLALQRAAGDRFSPIDLAPAVALVAIGVALQYLSVYRDAGIRDLPVLVTDGAYAGLYTNQEKRDFLTALDRDLAAVSAPDCRIVFYDTFPAGYLLGHGRPATNATWLLDVEDDQEVSYQRLLLAYYERHGGLPDIVVRLDLIPLTNSTGIEQTYAKQEPLERTFGAARYVTARSGHGYRILRKRDTTCSEPRASP